MTENFIVVYWEQGYGHGSKSGWAYHAPNGDIGPINSCRDLTFALDHEDYPDAPIAVVDADGGISFGVDALPGFHGQRVVLLPVTGQPVVAS